MLQRKGVSTVKKQLYNILSFIFSMFENKNRTNIEKRQKSGNKVPDGKTTFRAPFSGDAVLYLRNIRKKSK
jgi:hypothetical protein